MITQPCISYSSWKRVKRKSEKSFNVEEILLIPCLDIDLCPLFLQLTKKIWCAWEIAASHAHFLPLLHRLLCLPRPFLPRLRSISFSIKSKAIEALSYKEEGFSENREIRLESTKVVVARKYKERNWGGMDIEARVIKWDFGTLQLPGRMGNA